MKPKEKSGFAKTFSIWFGMGALMFGTYCGASMASGVYATTYIVPLGGGWALAWLLMFFVFMTFFCAIGLDFVRAYKVRNYNEYYLALYGVHKPGANRWIKGGVTIFFDIFTVMKGLVNVAATVALFAELMHSLLGVPMLIASIIGILLFAVLTISAPRILITENRITARLTISAIVISVLNLRRNAAP